SALWCTNLDLIFSYLANGAGLATRHISTGLSEGDFSTGNHCFSEVYLPELKQWAYVDLTAATIFIKLKNKFLNVVEVAQLNRMGLDKSDLHAIACINGEIDTVPFTGSISALAEYYFYPGVSFTFYFSEYLRKKDSPDILTRGIKFFNTKPYYAIFSEGGCQTFNFVLFVRVASGYLLASVSLLLIIISIVYFLKSNNRRC
ncbi:MAG TPA: hypothetical protein VIK74_10360, partial [Parasegetibacter sp.]